MGFKETTRSMDFASLALVNCLGQNRSIKLMDQLSNTINWARVESILLSHYTVGTREEGPRAYPPLMLFKCMLLQKWFRIQSDPELENQINGWLSFKTFLGLAFSKPAPDLTHRTFPPSPASAAGCPKPLWMLSTLRSCVSSSSRGSTPMKALPWMRAWSSLQAAP